MYKNYIHVQIDNEVFRINKKYEKFLFFYHILLKEILTEEETELLRKYLTGRKYDKVLSAAFIGLYVFGACDDGRDDKDKSHRYGNRNGRIAEKPEPFRKLNFFG